MNNDINENTELSKSDASGSTLMAEYMEIKEIESYYENSWDLLMPIIEKICKEKFEDGEVIKLRTFGVINDEGFFMVRFDRHPLFYSESLIQASYGAVVDFLRNRVNNLI